MICKIWRLAQIFLMIFSIGAFCNPEWRERMGISQEFRGNKNKVGLLGKLLVGAQTFLSEPIVGKALNRFSQSHLSESGGLSGHPKLLRVQHESDLLLFLGGE